MKEFASTLKQTLQLNKKDIATYIILAIVSGMIGIIIPLIMGNIFIEQKEYIELGFICAVSIDMLIWCVNSIFSIPIDFNLAVSMGKTRKVYVPTRYVVLVSELIVIFAVAKGVNIIEKVIYQIMLPQSVAVTNVNVFFTSPIALLVILFALPALIILLGILYIRYQKKFAFIAWVAWMLGCTGIAKIIPAIEENPDSFLGKIGWMVINFFSQTDTLVQCIGIIASSIIALYFAGRLLRRQHILA